MTIHIDATPTTTPVAGTTDHPRLTLRQAVVADIKRNTSQALHGLVGSATHVGNDVVAFGLFIVGGQDQRRMVEWTRRHS